MHRDRVGGGLDADRAEAGVRHPAHHRAADDRGDADDGRRGCAQRVDDSGQPEDGADRHDGVRRREQHDVGFPDRAEHDIRRPGPLDSDLHEPAGLDACPVLHPPLLEVDQRDLARIGVEDLDVCLDLIVGGREERDTEVPAGRQPRGGFGERRALSQHARARDVRAQVEVAEGEPRPAHPVGGELRTHALGLIRTAPSALNIVYASEGIHDRVEIGAHTQTGEPEIIARVGDGRDVETGQRAQPPEKLGAADPPGKNGDLHRIPSASGRSNTMNGRRGPATTEGSTSQTSRMTCGVSTDAGLPDVTARPPSSTTT